LTKSKWTPLHFACDRGHYEVAEVLLTCGADYTIKDGDDHDACYYAQHKNFTNIVDLIREFEQQPAEQTDEKESTKQTPAAVETPATTQPVATEIASQP
jgi:ankyrin repeat protein